MVMLLMERSCLNDSGYIPTLKKLVEASRRWFPKQRWGVVRPQNRCRQFLDLLGHKDSRGHINAHRGGYSR